MNKNGFLFTENTDINRRLWDETIKQSKYGNIFSLSVYLDAVSPGWCALIKSGYSAVFPLPEKKKVGITYISQPFFNQQLGLFSLAEPEESDWNFCLNFLHSHYKIINLNLPFAAKTIASKTGFKIKQHNNYVLDLSNEYTAIKLRYSTNQKRNIQKSQISELQIVQTENYSLLLDLFRQNKGAEISFLNDEHYSVIEKLIRKLQELKFAKIECAFHEEQAVAGILWIEWKNRTVFLFSAVSTAGKQLHAMSHLVDNYIKRNAKTDTILDFEGSDNESLSRFYKSFGAELKPYISIESTARYWFQKLKNLLG